MFKSANQEIDKLLINEEFRLHGFVRIEGVQTLLIAGAIDVVHPITFVSSAGAIAMTLANGVEGQIKTIKAIDTVAGTITITPTTYELSTISITATNQAWTGIFYKGEWKTLFNQGCTLA